MSSCDDGKEGSSRGTGREVTVGAVRGGQGVAEGGAGGWEVGGRCLSSVQPLPFFISVWDERIGTFCESETIQWNTDISGSVSSEGAHKCERLKFGIEASFQGSIR